MKALCLIYSSDEWWAELSDTERETIAARYREFARRAGDAGVLEDGAELQPASTATTVRVRGSETLLDDGPFAETREQVSGYFVLDCESLEEVVALAGEIPGAEHGTVEVRPAWGNGS